MHKKSYLWQLVLVLSATLVLTGCGGTKMSPADKEDTQAEATTYELIFEEGRIVAGLDENNFPPMGFWNENQELLGFDIEFGEELAKRLGVTIEWQPTEWDGDAVIISLYHKKFDFILSSMSVTPDRMEKINFSTPYVNAGLVMVVKKGATGYETTFDLANKNVGGTDQAAALNTEDLKKLKLYEHYSEAFQDLESGLLDVVMADAITARNIVAHRPDIFEIVGEQLTKAPMAIGVRKEDEDLLAAINAIIDEMQADGTLTDISMKWFGFDVTL